MKICCAGKTYWPELKMNLSFTQMCRLKFIFFKAFTKFKRRVYILAVSAFCTVFGEVYEHFSHNVYSAYMVFAFAFPLAGGALLFGYFLICAAYVKK